MTTSYNVAATPTSPSGTFVPALALPVHCGWPALTLLCRMRAGR